MRHDAADVRNNDGHDAADVRNNDGHDAADVRNNDGHDAANVRKNNGDPSVLVNNNGDAQRIMENLLKRQITDTLQTGSIAQQINRAVHQQAALIMSNFIDENEASNTQRNRGESTRSKSKPTPTLSKKLTRKVTNMV